jgi:phosphoribosyl-ATP pyrophosphohydrolase/phosphoribosyl-AMP cyclohydrolase
MDVQVGMALYKGLINPIDTFINCLNLKKQAPATKSSLEQELIPTIVQDENNQVLMLAYSSPQSLALALKHGTGIYYSRSRREIWEKGKTSGHTQELISCRTDCDRDSLIFRIRQVKAACHTGSYSCFGSENKNKAFSIESLFELLRQRRKSLPDNSYSTTLFKDRKKLLKKITEETFEVTTFESQENLRWEIADLLYFVSTLAVDEGLDWQDIINELGGRQKADSAN